VSAAQEENSEAISIDDDVELLTEQIKALKELGAKDQKTQSAKTRATTSASGGVRHLPGGCGGWCTTAPLGCSTRPMNADFNRSAPSCALSDLIDRFELAHPVFSDPPPAKAKRHRDPRRTNPPRGLLHRR
jgi:hypothetical protein